MKLVRRCLVVAAFAVATLCAGSALAAQVSPQSVLALSFSDSQHGYLAGGYTAVDGVLAYTADGGATWSPTQFPGRRAWAVGASNDGASATAVADYFDEEILTVNSGGTWAADSPVFGGVPGFGGTSHINDVAYLSGGRVAVGMQEGTALNGDVAVIARESGGAWTPTFIPLYPPDSNGDPVLSYARLASIDATSGGDVAWAVGTEYTLPQNADIKTSLIYRTTDGGVTWDPDLATGALRNDVSCVSAADASVAYATYTAAGLGSRFILRRSAAGTWSKSPQIAASFAANALDAYDADHLVVVGDGGKIYYTANATAATPSWAQRTMAGLTAPLYGVQMTGPDSFVAVGGNETVVRFTGATGVGCVAPTNPTVAVASPAQGFPLSFTGSISGTAADTGVGVAKVEVRIMREDNTFWNGSAWVADANQWNLATGTRNWTYPFIPSGSPTALTIAVRVTDGMNLQATSTITAAGGGPIDATPPVTTSNAKATYPTSGGTIALSATDAGGSGVAHTYHRPASSGTWTEGTSYAVPTTPGTYTLYFYSVDGAGNVESPPKSTTFQVTDATPVSVWRFRYEGAVGNYLWTSDPGERDTIKANLVGTWTFEGQSYWFDSANPVNKDTMWRFKNKYMWSYFYTADPGERAAIQADPNSIWEYEGATTIKIARTTPTAYPVYRFRCLSSPTYLWTADAGEMAKIRDTLQSEYELEGVSYWLGR